jgi:hypothetical protein
VLVELVGHRNRAKRSVTVNSNVRVTTPMGGVRYSLSLSCISFKITVLDSRIKGGPFVTGGRLLL